MDDLEIAREDSQSATNSYLAFAEHWHDVHTLLRNLRSEDYRCGRLALIYHLHLSVSPAMDYVSEASEAGIESFAVAIFTANTFNPSDLKLRNKKPVLVANIELMDEVNCLSIPSLVRLYLVKKCPTHVSDGSLFYSVTDKLFKMHSGWEDRKVICPPILSRRVSVGQLEPSVVKSSSEIMNRVPHDKGKIVGNGFRREYLERFISGFRIALHGDFVNTALTELPNAKVEIVDVLFGSFEF